MTHINENKFYQALENIFTGANIEGDSGYVNLLKIKSSYYKLILEQFKKDIEKDQTITDSFKEEFFDKLYSFFEKYFSESGSVYFVKTANWQRVYEQVYTDNKDVVLFWKTHMLYYVKSDILFQSIDVAITNEESKQDYNFYFDVGNLQAKQNNEKKSLIFTFREIKEEKTSEEILNEKQGKKTFVFDVAYSERGNKIKIDDIVKETKIPETILEKAFATFRKQSEVDFFINKNAEKFLTEQLDMYLHQILLNEENKFDQVRLDQLKTIKTFALKIIKFIAQFEDELVRVWNKPKFALGSNYVISLKTLQEYLKTKNKESELSYIIREIDNELEKKGEYFENFCLILKEKYRNIDMISSIIVDEVTYRDGYFHLQFLRKKSLKENISIENGLVLQANKKDKIKELGKFVRKEVEDKEEIVYFHLSENDFNRQGKIEQELYKEKFSIKDNYEEIFIDTKYFNNDFRLYFLGLFDDLDALIDGTLIKSDNYQALNTIMPKFKGKINLFWTDPPFNTENPQFLYNDKFKDSSWLTMMDDRISLVNQMLNENGSIYIHLDENADYLARMMLDKYFIFRNEIIADFYGGEWLRGNQYIGSAEYALYYTKGNEYTFNTDYYEAKDFRTIYSGFLTHRFSQFNYKESSFGFKPSETTQKTEDYLQKYIRVSSKEGEIVLDIFAGTGTTIATAHKFGRKWIGIEMGNHYDDITVNRMKKVLIGDMAGVSKEEDVQWKGGGFFKYYSLEQYEDTLRNMKYKDSSPNSIFDSRKAFEQYIFYADQKFAHILETEKETLELDFDKLYPNIDFTETISNLLGLPIKRITKTSVILADGDNEKEIKTDYKNMTDSEKLAFVRLLKPMIWWGE